MKHDFLLLQVVNQVKFDGVAGRSKTYEAIVNLDTMPEPDLQESFNV